MIIKNRVKNFCYKLYYHISSEKVKRRFFIGFNRWLFQEKGIKFGNNLKVYNYLYLYNLGSIIIGDNFTFSSGDCINPICRNIKGCIHVMKDAKLIIADHVGISSACIWVQNEINIGNHVNIGGNCIIIDNDAHPIDFIKRRDPPTANNTTSKPISIEDDVWIGANCTILKGVTIGARSIIGAGSVVTSEIPKDCIAAGNPCKIIKYLK